MEKNNPLICCFWMPSVVGGVFPTISAPAPTAFPTKRPWPSLDLQNDQTQCTQTLNHLRTFSGSEIYKRELC